MDKKTAIAHFGSAAALAKALGISAAAVSDWNEIIPEGRAYQLQVLTSGMLRVDPAAYEKNPKQSD